MIITIVRGKITRVVRLLKEGVFLERTEVLVEEKKKINKSSTAKTVKSFPSITPPPTPKSKNLPTSNAVSSKATSAKDIDNFRKDFMAKQQAVQPIKAQGTVGALSF